MSELTDTEFAALYLYVYYTPSNNGFDGIQERNKKLVNIWSKHASPRMNGLVEAFYNGKVAAHKMVHDKEPDPFLHELSYRMYKADACLLVLGGANVLTINEMKTQ